MEEGASGDNPCGPGLMGPRNIRSHKCGGVSRVGPPLTLSFLRPLKIYILDCGPRALAHLREGYSGVGPLDPQPFGNLKKKL